MRYILIALFTEASPIIKSFDLQLKHKKPFKIYENENIKLIISGIGNIQAASALTYLLTKYPPKNIDKIFNIGICASSNKDDQIGTIYQIKKIVDKSTNHVYHLKSERYLQNTTIATYATVQTKIDQKYHLADMESAGFYISAKKFIASENITVLKIISDHMEDKIPKKEEVETMVEKHLPLFHKILSATDED